MGRQDESREQILDVLADADNHQLRFEELVRRSGKARATVWSKLKKLQKENIVERIVNTDTLAVYYKSLEEEEEVEKRSLMADLLADRLRNTKEMLVFLEITSNIMAIHELLMVSRLQTNLNTCITERYQKTKDYQDRLKAAIVQTPDELKGLKLAIIGLASRLFKILWSYPQLLGIEADENIQAKAEKNIIPAIPLLHMPEIPLDPKELPKELIDPESPHGQLLRNIQDFSDRVWQIKAIQEFEALQEGFSHRISSKLMSLLYQKNAKLLFSPEKADKETITSFLSSWVGDRVDDVVILIEGAHELGISTEGKRIEQIAEEMFQKQTKKQRKPSKTTKRKNSMQIAQKIQAKPQESQEKT